MEIPLGNFIAIFYRPRALRASSGDENCYEIAELRLGL
jgi:hypothetical protein